jgi:hypothetical protein
MEIKNSKDLKNALRSGPYAWPGGYPVYFIASDGEALSFKAVKENYKEVLRAVREQSDYGWRVIYMDVNWGEYDWYCAHSGERIESAYGE